MNSRIITLATLLLASTLFAKPTYLPPLELKSKASNDVQAFLNEEKLTTDTIIKKCSIIKSNYFIILTTTYIFI